MKNYGETLFGGSGFIRWSLTPFVLLFAALMPLLINQWTPAGCVVMAFMEFLCVALLAGFWLPARFGHWAFRILAGLVFLAYVGYLIHESCFTDVPFKIFESDRKASPRNALLGFFIIGLPALWYALFGRFTFQKPESKVETDKSDDD